LPWFSWLPLRHIPDAQVLDEHDGVILLRSFDDLSAKSFLMLAILLYNFEILTLAYFQ